MVLNPRAGFILAQAVRHAAGAPIGDVFAMVSGLYFRGKLAYARAFAAPPRGVHGVLVITPNRGLLHSDERVTAGDLRSFAEVDIDEDDARYRAPLERDARALAGRARGAEVVLLGSVATGKYLDVLRPIFPGRLLFPSDFPGRGDMSRGSILLKAARAGTELSYTRA